MSVVTYNGVQLPYASCTNYNMTPIYDSVGAVDPYLMRYDISINCVINTKYTNILDRTDGLALDGLSALPSNAAELMRVIEMRLRQPRMAFSFKFNGIELIPQPPEGVAGTVDAKHGPVTDVRAFLLTEETFLVQFRIMAHYVLNTKVTKANGVLSISTVRASPVVSNRWTESVSIDESGYSTRTRMGKYTIRSDNVEGKTADDFRTDFAVCSIPTGFVRANSQYDLSPDGLGIQYRIIDREVFKQPPGPAFESRGRYIETTTDKGAIRFGEATVNLRASPNVSQVQLIDTAIAVVSAKVFIQGALTGANKNVLGSPELLKAGKLSFAILEYAAISVDMYDNSVEVFLRAMLGAVTAQGDPKKRIHGVASLTGGQFIADTPGSDSIVGFKQITYTPPQRGRGAAALFLKAAGYFDPSLSADSLKLASDSFTKDAVVDPVVDTGLTNVKKLRTGTAKLPGELGKSKEDRKPNAQ